MHSQHGNRRRDTGQTAPPCMPDNSFSEGEERCQEETEQVLWDKDHETGRAAGYCSGSTVPGYASSPGGGAGRGPWTRRSGRTRRRTRMAKHVPCPRGLTGWQRSMAAQPAPESPVADTERPSGGGTRVTSSPGRADGRCTQSDPTANRGNCRISLARERQQASAGKLNGWPFPLLVIEAGRPRVPWWSTSTEIREYRQESRMGAPHQDRPHSNSHSVLHHAPLFANKWNPDFLSPIITRFHSQKSELSMRIAVASGKGGTGKDGRSPATWPLVASRMGRGVAYVDCDVEEPNGHIFLRPEIDETRSIDKPVPTIDPSRCKSLRCVQSNLPLRGDRMPAQADPRLPGIVPCLRWV